VNMKKLFPEKKLTRKSISEFLDKKGFYIVLALCVIVVGATAIFVVTRNITSSNEGLNGEKIIPEEFGSGLITDSDIEPDENSPIDVAAVVPDTGEGEKTADNTDAEKHEAVTEKEKPAVLAEKEVKETPAPKKQEDDKAKTSPDGKSSGTSTAPAAKGQSFIMPVIGGVTFAFAQDRLVYSKTLEEWRTHSGTDLAADRGTPVKVVADGVVSEIKNDPRFGITVIVEHPDGIKTVYANLAGDDMVNPNQKLKQGDIIGCVGNTALFESAEQSHLHFEVLKDNEPVDPETFLPISKEEDLK
jgi:murein DD-endopeptidase MepM/ murein hydrolase activator NlpD